MKPGAQHLPNRRWLDWTPTERIIAESPECEPTKPSEPGFVGFEGAPLNSTAKIEGEPSPSCGTAEDADSTSSALSQLGKCIRAGVDSAASTEGLMSWTEWKAAALNMLFFKQRTAGQPGRITAATVRHGEAGRERVDPAGTDEQPMSRAEATE